MLANNGYMCSCFISIKLVALVMKYAGLYRSLRNSDFSYRRADGKVRSPKGDDGLCLTTLGPLAGPKGGVGRQASSRLRELAERRHSADFGIGQIKILYYV